MRFLDQQLLDVLVETWDTDYFLALSFVRALGLDPAKDGRRIRRRIGRLAENGNPRAQHALAKLVRVGLFFRADRESALMWCLRASSQGYAPAQHMAWYLYSDFLESLENAEGLASQSLQTAVARGYAPALRSAGIARLEGNVEDKRVGYALLGEAAKKGEALAQYLVGEELIVQGGDVAISQGREFMVSSASAGYRAAIQTLSSFYHRGIHGFEKKLDHSSRLFAESESAMPSEVYLGLLDEWSAI
jgi:uncharacterized protein